MTDDVPLMYNGKMYRPSRSLTPTGFTGNKNITKTKLLLVPDFYNHIHKLLPYVVFIPCFDKCESKECCVLSLVVDAYNNGSFKEAEAFKKNLHHHLKWETIEVMHA